MSNASIYRRIREKRNQQRQCRTAISGLNREKGVQTREVDAWRRQHQICSQQPITSEIVIRNTFEGECARQAQRHLPEAVLCMEETKQACDHLLDSENRQIERLYEHIDELEGEIQDLYDQLDDDD